MDDGKRLMKLSDLLNKKFFWMAILDYSKTQIEVATVHIKKLAKQYDDLYKDMTDDKSKRTARMMRNKNA